MATKIIPDSIRDVLDYDPETGNLIWKNGRTAGGKHHSGYINITFQGLQYGAHRVAWFIYHGTQPNVVDHINRDKADNRIANLRDVDRSQNGLNQHRTGVRWTNVKTGGGYRYRCAKSTYRGQHLYVGNNIVTAWFRRIMAERQDHPIGLPAPDGVD